MKFLSLFAAIALALPGVALAQEQSVKTVNIDCTKYNPNSSDLPGIIRDTCFPQQPNPKEITPEKVREWGSLGKEFSSAVVETARELGMAVNEFLYTPVGFLIAFYFMWDIFGGIIIGIPLFIALWWFYFKLCKLITRKNWVTEYEYTPILWGLFSKKRIKSNTYKNGDEAGVAYTILAIPALVLSILILGFLIF